MSSKYGTQFRRWLLSSPPAEWVTDQLREFTIGALSQGPIPKHIAFEMDGNRRYARTQRIETVEGHYLGFEAMAKILEVCYKTGVKVVTVYAFSIENFKRSKFEVDALMDLAKFKLTQMAEHGELCDRYGASIRILGQRDLVKEDVLEAIEKAVEMTKHNKKAILNVCFPYTSRDEITTAIRDTVIEYTQPIQPPLSTSASRSPFSQSQIENKVRAQNHLSSSPPSPSLDPSTLTDPDQQHLSTSPSSSTGLRSPSVTSLASSITTAPSSTTPPSTTTNTSHPHPPTSIPSTTTLSIPTKPIHKPQYPSPELITSRTLNAHMFTGSNPPLDLLIRTSGVERLSDFMLWQAHQDTEIVFLKCLWPEFDLWRFLPVLVQWQWRMMRQGRVRWEGGAWRATTVTDARTDAEEQEASAQGDGTRSLKVS